MNSQYVRQVIAAVSIAVVEVLLLAGCGEGSKVVELPVVTEESMAPEERAQWERMKQAGAAPGAPNAGFVDPAEYMRQQMQAHQNATGAAPAN